jgi:hypothetical protein
MPFSFAFYREDSVMTKFFVRCIGLLALCSIVSPAVAGTTTLFAARLDQAQEVPTPTPTGAVGTGTFRFDSATSQVTYSVSVSGLGSAAFAAHMHLGDWGVPGPIVFGLTQTSATTWGGVTPMLSPAQVSLLFAHQFYVNVHTSGNGDGEIRGQIVFPDAVRARFGNVDTAGGNNPAPVLRIGGSLGHPIYRMLVRPPGMTTIDLVLPPAGGNGLYAVWVEPGEPTMSTLTPCVIADGVGGTELLGTAGFCLPANNQVTPMSCPCPPSPFEMGFTSRPLGAGAAAAVCLHPSPADPRPPTSLSINLPLGKWTVLGVIFDPNAPTTGPRKVSLTNSVTIQVR